MSDYLDETPLTEEEIAAAIAAARKAKAQKSKNKNKNNSSKKNNTPKKSDHKDEESSENLFSEIDSAADDESEEEELSPKMKSAKSFSNAFAAARSKREEELKKKKELEEAEAEEEDEEEEEFEEESDNEEFEVDTEDEDYEEEDGIFEPDEEDSGYTETVSVDDEDDDEYEDDEEDDDEDDDDEDGTFSTKTKVIIGIIIAVLVAAIIGAGIYFLNRGDSDNNEPATSSVAPDNSVTSIRFADPSLSLRVNETVSLDIIIEPESAEDKVLKLKSNDPSIAKVDESGKITGVSSGSTTITATLKSNETITASLIVNVIDEKQNAINVYNSFVNSILDGSTDIDSTDTDSDEETDSEEDTENDSDSDSDTDSEKTVAPKSVLEGSIIRDLNSDGDLELALYYTNEQEGSNVRIFYLANEGEEEEEETEEDEEDAEPQYDEDGNLIIADEDDGKDSDKSANSEPAVKVLTEADLYSEMYSVCYNTLETDATGWDTCTVEVKEDEVAKARVTILSEDYTAPTYVYESDDEQIATVDNQGNIKGIKPGTCFITVTSPLNSDAMAKIKVKVKDDTDLLEDYLAQIPTVNSTNDNVIPTETLTGKAITDLDGDGVSELLLRFSYGNNVETINMVKVENDQCVVYKTYNNLSDLYEYYEGDGSYKNSILIHYTTGKVCMEYKAVVAKTDSKSKTSEQRILSVENNGSLSELVKFATTTDISTKTVTSEVVVDEGTTSTTSSRIIDDDSDVWYDDTDSEDDNSYYYDSDEDSDDEDDDNNYYYDDNNDDDDYGYEYSYVAFTFDEIEAAAAEGGIDLSSKIPAKKLPQTAGAPGDDDDDDDYDNDYNNNDDDDDDDNSSEATSSRTTSTVTTEVTEETTKYFVNDTPVEQSVYEETLATYSARYSVWGDWESV